MQAGMPQYSTQAPFELHLARQHGDRVRSDGTSTASDVLSFGGHSGTHIDALGHFSLDGRLHDGSLVADVQRPGGLLRGGIDELGPQFRRALLLDVAAARAVSCLDAGYEVTRADLLAAAERAGVMPARGDAVLVRTGWTKHWPDSVAYAGERDGTPGPGADAVDWLVECGVALVGGDTLTFEVRGPGHELFVGHRKLLVEAGVPIIECLDLEELASLAPAYFTVAVLPLRLTGATASPVRPVALLESAEEQALDRDGDDSAV